MESWKEYHAAHPLRARRTYNKCVKKEEKRNAATAVEVGNVGLIEGAKEIIREAKGGAPAPVIVPPKADVEVISEEVKRQANMGRGALAKLPDLLMNTNVSPVAADYLEIAFDAFKAIEASNAAILETFNAQIGTAMAINEREVKVQAAIQKAATRFKSLDEKMKKK